VFSQYFVSATETKLQRTVRQWLSGEEDKGGGWLENSNNEPDSVRDFGYRSSILDGVSRVDNAVYRGVLSLILSKKARDFGPGRKQLAEIQSDEIEDHHIYPKRFLGPYGIKGEKVNNIANRTPLMRTTNAAIGSKAPHVYLSDAEIVGSEPVEGTVSGHLISPSLVLTRFTLEIYDQFLTDRTKRIG